MDTLFRELHRQRMPDWSHIQALRPELLAYARSISDSPEEAEDLLSDAIERAARTENHPKDLRAFKIWMFRIIKNISIDELRKRRVRREYAADAKRLYSDASAQTPGPEMTILLRRAFEKLNSAEREVLFLVDILEMKYAEAAEVMGVPTGTVMSRVSRARQALLARVDADQTPSLTTSKTTK